MILTKCVSNEEWIEVNVNKDHPGMEDPWDSNEVVDNFVPIRIEILVGKVIVLVIVAVDDNIVVVLVVLEIVEAIMANS